MAIYLSLTEVIVVHVPPTDDGDDFTGATKRGFFWLKFVLVDWVVTKFCQSSSPVEEIRYSKLSTSWPYSEPLRGHQMRLVTEIL